MQDFILSVADILGRPGEYRDVMVRAPLSGVGNALARLEENTVATELRIESVMEGVLVTGRLEAHTGLQCARCLADFPSKLSLRLCELFVAPGHDAAEEDDIYKVAGTEIDLEPALRDAAVLALPLNPLCGPDCKGLCARCGTDLNISSCDCKEDDFDPRWAALSDLRERLEN